MTELIIATRNAHKVAEIRAVLPPEFSLRSLREFPNAPEVREDQGTFGGNASKKAVDLARWLTRNPGELARARAQDESGPSADAVIETSLECYCLADDSGLEVDALNGAPGVHSARFANLDHGGQGNSTDASNNAKLLRLLEGVPAEKRTARFRCVIALTPVLGGQPHNASPVCEADEAELRTQLFEGVCEGHVLEAARGSHGFGYDPLFVPRGFRETFAELGEETKNRISHRAQALFKLLSFFRERGARVAS